MDGRAHEDVKAQVDLEPEEHIFSWADILLDSALRFRLRF
jgi:hypothetical protein